MLDANLLRNDLDAVAARLAERGYTLDRVRYLELDQRRRAALQEAEALKAERNRVSEEVGRLKRAKENADTLIAQQREVGDKLKELEAAEREIEAAFKDFLAGIPNPPHTSVPSGRDEHANVEIKRWGQLPVIDAPKDHVELGTALGILDLDRAAKLSGARFAVLKGLGAKLERALITFMLDRQTGAGYTEIIPPYLVNPESMYGTGQLPKFEEDLFKTRDDRYLIPTAEVPLTNLAREEIIPEAALPWRLTALTPCFRSEAGSAGRDTRGMLRQHQFQKVELVSITRPEESDAEHERMTRCAERVLTELGLVWRRLFLSAGDTGFGAARTYDLEVWLPGQQAWREISSCSNCRDFQARRMNARMKPSEGKGNVFVHTLNGSGVAVGRALIAVLETHQQEDGSVAIPAVLQPYMGGLTRIGR